MLSQKQPGDSTSREGFSPRFWAMRRSPLGPKSRTIDPRRVLRLVIEKHKTTKQ
jgi:hypothetical protein